MQGWTTFFEVLCGTAATLLGLLFVSVSVNAEAILGGPHKHSERLAEQAFQNYLAVVVVCLVALYPDTSQRTLGSSVLLLSAVWSFWVIVRLWQTLSDEKGRDMRRKLMRRFAPSVVALGLLVYAGIGMIQHLPDREPFVPVALIVFLLSATAVSWQLLIAVGRERYRKDLQT